MQSKLIGGWLLSTSVGVLGLITLGGYTRLKRAGLAMVDWKPLSIRYPQSELEWEKEYKRYQEFPEFQQSQVPLDEFKEIYFIEYSHRLYARTMGLYLVLPLAVFWKKGLIPQSLKPKLLGITAMFGVQGVLGWVMVKSGLKEREVDGRVKVQPINLAVHLFCGVGLFSVIFFTALGCLRKSPEAILNTIEKVNAGRAARKKYMTVLHLGLITVFAGALVAGSDAGKVLNNWPWYGENYVFPRKALEIQPVHRNFIENPNLIQFVHRTLAYVTYASVLDLWLYMRTAKLILPYMLNAHGVLAFSTLQMLLGVTALMRGSPFYESLSHQLNSLLFLSTVLYGLHTFRKPNKQFISSLFPK